MKLFRKSVIVSEPTGMQFKPKDEKMIQIDVYAFVHSSRVLSTKFN